MKHLEFLKEIKIKNKNKTLKVGTDCSGIEAVLPFFIGRIGEIRLLAVDRNYRNHGIATKMFIAFAKHIFSGKYLDCGTLKGYINSSIEISKL